MECVKTPPRNECNSPVEACTVVRSENPPRDTSVKWQMLWGDLPVGKVKTFRGGIWV